MVDVNIDPAVFNDIYVPYLNDYTRTQIFYGGASSGKSVFLSQRAVVDIMRGGRNYLVCRAVGRTIRKSVFNEIWRVIINWGLVDLFDANKSELTITCTNGYQIIFAGLDDVEKLKSLIPQKGVITDIWVEEATETDPDAIKQLYRRQRGGDDSVPKRLTLSFNPIMQTHHIYHNYFRNIGWADRQTKHQGDELSILKTWYIHNRFLTTGDIADLEGEQDEYYRDVYTFGNWGILGDVIFKNWRVEDLSGMRDQFTNRRNGLDFGFASDPAALSRSHYDRKRKTVYVFDELYERGLTNNVLAEMLKPVVGQDHIKCDSAEPKSVAELVQHGISASGARKGKDSVIFGIQWLQQQDIVIDKSCINARNEFQQYHWKKDKDGNSIRQPVDKNDHIIDATRYAYEDDMGGEVQFFDNPLSSEYAIEGESLWA